MKNYETKSSRKALAASAGGRYVALLRGINVGGKNKLPMKDLAAMFEKAGCTDVRTYIASGNVVLSTAPGIAKRLAALISRRIAEDFGYRVPVVLRTAGEFYDVAAKNPFLKSDGDTDSLFVGFLAELPDPRHVAALDPKRSPGDSFKVRGRDIYMHLGTGAADTKLTNAYFDAALKTTSTFRNWRTVMKLIELTQEPQASPMARKSS